MSTAPQFQRYMQALLEGDAREMERQIRTLADTGTPLLTIFRDYLRDGLYEVGRLWECGQASVAVEHLAASATSVVLSTFQFQPAHRPPGGRRAIITCVPDELHDIGALMIANLCDVAGWKVMLLGANTPAADLLSLVAERQPDMLGLSVTEPTNLRQLEEIATLAGTKFPSLEILIGGQALEHTEVGVRCRNNLLARFQHIRYPHTLEELQIYLDPGDAPPAEG